MCHADVTYFICHHRHTTALRLCKRAPGNDAGCWSALRCALTRNEPNEDCGHVQTERFYVNAPCSACRRRHNANHKVETDRKRKLKEEEQCKQEEQLRKETKKKQQQQQEQRQRKHKQRQQQEQAKWEAQHQHDPEQELKRQQERQRQHVETKARSKQVTSVDSEFWDNAEFPTAQLAVPMPAHIGPCSVDWDGLKAKYGELDDRSQKQKKKKAPKPNPLPVPPKALDKTPPRPKRSSSPLPEEFLQTLTVGGAKIADNKETKESKPARSGPGLPESAPKPPPKPSRKGKEAMHYPPLTESATSRRTQDSILSSQPSTPATTNTSTSSRKAKAPRGQSATGPSRSAIPIRIPSNQAAPMTTAAVLHTSGDGEVAPSCGSRPAESSRNYHKSPGPHLMTAHTREKTPPPKVPLPLSSQPEPKPQPLRRQPALRPVLPQYAQKRPHHDEPASRKPSRTKPSKEKSKAGRSVEKELASKASPRASSRRSPLLEIGTRIKQVIEARESRNSEEFACQDAIRVEKQSNE